MQLVGNDVVDLDDPAAVGAHRRERFVERVCTDGERRALALASDPGTLLWSFFAAKEAAYKVAAKLGPAPGFAHRRFDVAPDLGSVRFVGAAGDETTAYVLHLRVEAAPAAGFVHAVASTHASPALHAVLRAPADADPGVLARRALRRAVARALGCRIDALDVARDAAPGSWDGFAPPRLLLRGTALPGVDVSLSHDGRFVAFAAASGAAARGAWASEGADSSAVP